jgi:hypothetical protein
MAKKLKLIKLSRILGIAFVVAILCSISFVNLPVSADVGAVSIRVDSNADDSSYDPVGAAYDNAYTQELVGKFGAVQCSSAFRFTGVTIPDYATITSAYIQFTAEFTRATQTVTLSIKGEDTATPAAYGAAENYTTRTYTTASVPWTGSMSWTLNSTYDSADITSIINELYTSYGAYTAGDMAFEILSTTSNADNFQSAYAHDHTPAKAALLVINYTYTPARYWVGDSGDWSNAAVHWALTSGGGAGAGNLPDATMITVFDDASFTGGAQVVTVDAAAVCARMDWTDAADAPDLHMDATLTVGGNVTFLAGVTVSGTEAIIVTGTGNFDGAGITFPVLQLNGSAHTLSGANTFTTLTRTGTAADTTLTLAANQIITGTLTLTGNSINNRLTVQSSVHTTQRTLTAAVVTPTNVDFHDIIAAGASHPWDVSAIAGGSVDLGNNVDITFSYDRYWVGDSGNWNDAITHWAFSSGGTPDTAFLPSAIFDANFDASSFSNIGKTVTVNVNSDCKSMDWTGVGVDNPTFTANNFDMNIYGSLTLSSGMTVSFYNKGFSFLSANAGNNITTNGVTILNTPSSGVIGGFLFFGAGDWTLQDNLNVNWNGLNNLWGIEVKGGTLYTNDKTITWSNSTAMSVTIDGGTIALGNSTLNIGRWIYTSGTISVNTSTINCTGNFTGGNQTYSTVNITGASTIAGNNTFTTLNITGATASIAGSNSITTFITPSGTTQTITITAGTTQTITGTATLSGDATHMHTFTGGGEWFISKPSVNIVADYITLVNSHANGGAGVYFWAGAVGHSVNGGGNTHWIWATPPTGTTTAASTIHSTTAVLEGTFTIGGYTPVYVYFELATDAYWIIHAHYDPALTTAEQTKTALGSATQFVSALTNTTTYHYRISVRFVETGVDLYTYGADTTFVTINTPDVTTDSALNVTTSGADLIGSLTYLAGYTPVNVYFEYGLNISYGYSTLPQSKTAITGFWDSVTDLVPNVTYHYRAVADYADASSPTYGLDMTFVTTLAPGGSLFPTISRGAVFTGYRQTALSTGTIVIGTGLTVTPATLAAGYNLVTVTIPGGGGTFTITLATGNTGTVVNGTATVTGSPVSLHAGANTITVTVAGTMVVSIGAGDMLFIAEIFNTYTPLYLVVNPETRYAIRLLSADETTILAESSLRRWGTQPVSIYLNEANIYAHGIVYGSEYHLAMVGTFAGAPAITSYQLTADDWYGDDLEELDNWSLTTATHMQVYALVNPYTNSTDMLTDVTDVGQQLTEKGGSYFTIGINGLSSVRPSLFESAQSKPILPSQTAANAYDASKVWATQVGTKVATDWNKFGAILGVSGQLAMGYSIILIVIILSILGVLFGGVKGLPVIVLSFPLVYLGSYLGAIGIQYVIVPCIAMVMLFARQFWVKAT